MGLVDKFKKTGMSSVLGIGLVTPLLTGCDTLEENTGALVTRVTRGEIFYKDNVQVQQMSTQQGYAQPGQQFQQQQFTPPGERVEDVPFFGRVKTFTAANYLGDTSQGYRIENFVNKQFSFAPGQIIHVMVDPGANVAEPTFYLYDSVGQLLMREKLGDDKLTYDFIGKTFSLNKPGIYNYAFTGKTEITTIFFTKNRDKEPRPLITGRFEVREK